MLVLVVLILYAVLAVAGITDEHNDEYYDYYKKQNNIMKEGIE